MCSFRATHTGLAGPPTLRPLLHLTLSTQMPGRACRRCNCSEPEAEEAVSYTHLTLPTICSV
eukprot:10182581-Alexandrium_andersonii.AAC.1